LWLKSRSSNRLGQDCPFTNETDRVDRGEPLLIRTVHPHRSFTLSSWPIPDRDLTEQIPPESTNPSDAVVQSDRSRVDEAEIGVRLDRRWIGLTRMVESLVWSGLLLVSLVVGLIWMRMGPLAVDVLVLVLWLCLACLALLRILWWPRWAYDHWTYRVGEKVIELRRGVLWNVWVAIPMSRLQHVDLHRGPLERQRGLASLQLHTAGTKEASQWIPGLDLQVAERLRDRLIDAANRGVDARSVK
jgi:membrane protein YdbS with pleckstrin-like domain